MRLSSILVNIFTLNVKFIDTEMDSVLGIILWWLCGGGRGNEGTREQGNGAYPMFPMFPVFPMFPAVN